MASGRDRRRWAAAGGLALAAVVLERHHINRIAADPENALLREPPHGRELKARSADGTHLHVEVFGEAPDDGQTIVLGHGWTETIAYWIYEIAALSARGLRVVAYDLRGHGQSEPASRGDYSIARFGEDLEAVLGTCLANSQRAVLVGHSLGAMAIAAWAEQHDVQRRAAGAALLNTGVGDLAAEHLLVPVPWIAQLMNRAVPATAFVGSRAPIPRVSTPLGHAAVRYTAFGPAASPAQIAFYERMLVACPPDVRADVGIALSELELYKALPRLTVPTIVVAGAKDKLTPPSHAERIAEQLPQLRRLVVLPDTGHMSPLERPREVSELLAELTAEVASGARSAAA
jgi:pimeloyl-ACP methyl ester carboxylesterase